MEKIKIGILGASGYAGWELYQLMSTHPDVEIEFVTSESFAGKTLADIWPRGDDRVLFSAREVNFKDIDCAFLCLPHTTSAQFAAKALAAGAKVIDLSADLRLNDAETFAVWYQTEHTAPRLLPVVYGLPEHYRDQIKDQDVIANPGCYPTAILLGLLPLVKAGLVRQGTPLIIDAKSGTTGAGRKATQQLLLSEMQGNFKPYKIGHVHQHLGEIEQQLSLAGLQIGNITFAPHLLPIDRGILAAIYVQVTDQNAAINAIKTAYLNEPLVDVLPQGHLASLAHVVRTPKAVISTTASSGDTLLINVAIDNLLKGAASQAVQNFNILYDLQETKALLPG